MSTNHDEQKPTESYVRLKIGDIEVCISDEKDTGLEAVREKAHDSLERLTKLAKSNTSSPIR